MAKTPVLFINKMVGLWTLIEKKDKKWLCKCKCGTQKEVSSASLTSAVSKSCGCLRKQLLTTNNPMFNKDIAKKVSIGVKAAQTKDNIKKRTLAANTQTAKDKRIQTNILRYGGNSPAASLDVQQRMAITNLQRFGTITPAQNQSVKDQTKQYFIDTYGVDNIMKLDEYKKKVSEIVSSRLRLNGVELLPNGLVVVDECRVQGVLPTTYRNWRREFGADIAQQKLYGDRLTFRSKLEVNAVDLFLPLIDKGATVEIWNKKAHPDLRYKPDIRLSFKDRVIFIDVDGLYWHSSDPDVNEDDYHKVKALEFLEKGVTLLQFREDEIYNKPSIIFSMVEHRLGLTSLKYGARDLEIKVVSTSESNMFLEDCHLMGSMYGTSNVGLYLDSGEMVSLLSYRVFDSKSTIDVSRFCVKRGITIAGAFSRLLSYVEHLNPNIKYIQNFVDCRYSAGVSSIKSGFVLESVHLGWRWTDGKVTYNRQHCQASKELGLTEIENAKRLKLYKLFDAGQAKLIKTIKGIL